MPKPVWLNPIEEAAWRENNCARCFQPDEARKRLFGDGEGCPLPLLASAGKLPQQWTRRRNAAMGQTYRCSEFLSRPAVNRRTRVPDETPPMFDVEPTEYGLVPVDNWPDYAAELRRDTGVDHA